MGKDKKEKNKKKKEHEEEIEPAIKSFRYIRPNIVKIFTHVILLYLTISGYLEFVSSETDYEDFLQKLKQPIIVDVMMINSTESCKSPYENITTTYFPQINDGCRCDDIIFLKETCPLIEKLVRNESDTKQWAANCKAENSGNNLRNLQVKSSFNPFLNFPKKCNCFEYITGLKQNKTIDIWFKNKKMCIKKNENITTIKYLQTAMEGDCLETDICQNYFCKTKFSKINDTVPCPIVDVYFDNKNSAGGNSIKVNEDRVWNLYKSSFYNKTFINNSTFENTVLVPILGISMSRSGKCVTGDASIDINYNLVDKVDCPKDQRYYTVNRQSLQTVLENNNYYSNLINLSGFNQSLNNDNKWSLDLEYAFHRSTITCLMNNYDTLNKDSYFSTKSQTDLALSDFQYKKLKIGYILASFLTFQTSFSYQQQLQIANLAINCFLVFISLFTISLKIMKRFYTCPNCLKTIFEIEIYFTFFLEIFIGVIGGSSYFILSTYIDFFSNLIDSNCVDNYVQYKLGSFSQSLSSTASQNFEIFLIVVIKVVIIIFSSFYYGYNKKGKLNCNDLVGIVRENINEGEEDDSDEENEELEKKQKKQKKKKDIDKEKEEEKELDNNDENPKEKNNDENKKDNLNKDTKININNSQNKEKSKGDISNNEKGKNFMEMKELN